MKTRQYVPTRRSDSCLSTLRPFSRYFVLSESKVGSNLLPVPVLTTYFGFSHTVFLSQSGFVDVYLQALRHSSLERLRCDAPSLYENGVCPAVILRCKDTQRQNTSNQFRHQTWKCPINMLTILGSDVKFCISDTFDMRVFNFPAI